MGIGKKGEKLCFKIFLDFFGIAANLGYNFPDLLAGYPVPLLNTCEPGTIPGGWF